MVATVGDAGLEMVLGELATIRDLKLAVPIVVFVDTQIGLIELKQRSAQLTDLAVNFGATDFPAVARALGGEGVKYEEVYLKAYETVSEVKVGLGNYLRFYNGRRPHSSLERQTPDQVYFNQLSTPRAA